jgi:hypothetical protein
LIEQALNLLRGRFGSAMNRPIGSGEIREINLVRAPSARKHLLHWSAFAAQKPVRSNAIASSDIVEAVPTSVARHQQPASSCHVDFRQYHLDQ